ncbi:hypothetical protein niasHT_020397 [Heterodera trifolii]|uniref:CCHC-type domain-containing protein n=1 Tax=Heterodera trifolii TaxID=157864 RepID=A0ABD2JXA0_9BILA
MSIQIVTTIDGSMRLAPFFTKAFCFSNHFGCQFVLEGISFCCSEQCYMYLKCLAFGDNSSASAILQSSNPAEIKRLGSGSRIRGFDTQKWRQLSIFAMVVANWNKFRQNDYLMQRLLSLDTDVLLVECSPTDCYWGIGLQLRDPDIRNMAKWRGKNILGRVLTGLRNTFHRQTMQKPTTAVNIMEQSTSAERAHMIELPLIGTLSLDVVSSDVDVNMSASAIQNENDIVRESDQNASADQNVNSGVEEFRNTGFGVSEKEGDELVDEFEQFSVSEQKGKIVEYVVCQVGENLVVAGKLRQMTNKNFPYFVSVSNEMVEKSEGFLRKLQLGDIVGVSSVEWREGYRHLAKRESEKSHFVKMWFVQKINWQASVVEISYINYAVWRENLGIVLRVKESVSSVASRRLYALVISAELQVSSRCYRRQLVDLDLDTLVEGQLVKVWSAVLPEQYLIESSYILPPQSEFKAGTEKMVEDGKGVLACVGPHEPWPYQHFYPLAKEMSMSEIELAEKIFSAVIAYSYEDEERKIVDGRFEGSATYNEGVFWLKFYEIDNAKMKRLKEIWEIDAQVMLKPSMDQKHFASGVVKETNVESMRSFGRPKFILWIAVKVTQVQERKNRDVHEELERAEEGGSFVAHPIIPQGLELRRACFASNLPSRVAKLDTNQGKLMRAVMGRPREQLVGEQGENLGHASAIHEFHPLMRKLNERQKVSAKLLLGNECCLVYQNAPPGVGKTYVASIVASILLSMNENVKIAIVTSANLPLAKLAQELDEVLGSDEMEESGSIAFFSGYAKEKYREMVEKLKRHILVSKLKSEEIQSKLKERNEENQDMRDVREYCQNYEFRPRLTKERKMASLYAEVANLRIVFATATMAENVLWTALTGTSVLIFDEATQGSWVILAHLVARMPKLEKVFVTGDRYQLGVHLQELPKILRKGFGLDSMVDQLVDSPNAVQNKLVTCYRMHPMLVECVSYASYEQHGERLGVGRSAEERSILTNSQFPLPMQNCPIVLMNVSGTCRQGVESFSLTNDVHTASAVQLVAALSGNLSRQDISIVVICLYLLQKDCIKSEFEDLGLNILVVSVDEYQAQEADITVVVTTRSSYREGNLSENSEFLTDSQRATVALSRARHGLFLIGDFAVLSVGEVWQRFIERASALTQIVGQSYIQLLRSGEFRRDRFGQLLDGEYRVVGDWAAGTSAASSTSTTTRQPTGETWRNWNVGRPLERKRLATEDIGPAPRRDENWRSTSWRQFTGTTFSRGGRGGSSTKCYNCGRTGHVARQCQERRRDDRR